MTEERKNELLDLVSDYSNRLRADKGSIDQAIGVIIKVAGQLVRGDGLPDESGCHIGKRRALEIRRNAICQANALRDAVDAITRIECARAVALARAEISSVAKAHEK